MKGRRWGEGGGGGKGGEEGGLHRFIFSWNSIFHASFENDSSGARQQRVEFTRRTAVLPSVETRLRIATLIPLERLLKPAQTENN